ncbi:MAG: DCC1-like thiol-disulfide oxidoreductase family protein [Granulosicoccaceae bacterium]
MGGLKKVFSIDLRSLALLRVCLASLILLDLFLRTFDMATFYTDDGILPRSRWIEFTNKFHFSIHAASGDLFWQILLFTLAAIFALGLLVGYRSKLMTLLSFIMLASLINRNQLITQAGDQLLVVMTFWALFLPIGARYSVDAALDPRYQQDPNNHLHSPVQPQPYFSMASIAVIFQVLYLYFFTAILKTGAAWRVRFDAAFYAVSLEHFATPIGAWIRQFPGLLKLGTLFVLFVEFIGPLLVLLPKPWPVARIIGLLMLASLHLAFMFMLHIGLFPLIDFMSLTVLIPSAIWIWLAARRKPAAMDNIILYYDQDCGFCLKMVLVLRELLLSQHVKIYPAQNTPEIYAIMEGENSWVVQGANGKHYLHWNAMRHLFAQRWAFKPIALIMSIPPLMMLGNWVYRWVANNRNTMSNITASSLPWHTVKIKPTMVGQLIALYFFVGITVYNITGLPGLSKHRPDLINRSLQAVRLDQRWSMFAPFPMTISIYPQIQATLRNGDKMNLYPLTDSSPNWEPPTQLYSVYKSYRWRKFLGKIRSTSDNRVRAAYGDYLCRTRNKMSLQRPKHIGIFDIHFVSRHTNTNEQPKRIERKMAWRHWCYADFDPANKM